MDTKLREVVNDLYLIITCVAIILNLFLVVIASKLQRLRLDIQVSILLACDNIILASIEIIILSYHKATGNNIDSLTWGCQVIGPLKFLGLEVSMMLISIIAIIRFYRTINRAIPMVIGVLYLFFSVYYTTIVVLAGHGSEFYLVSNDLDCSLVPTTGIISWLVAISFTGSLLLFLLITFGCYMGIMWQVSQLSQRREVLMKASSEYVIIDLNSSDLVSLQLDQLRRSRSKVARWIATVSVLYFLLILPSFIMLLVEFGFEHPKGSMIDTILVVGNLCFALISLVNPCLALFAHTEMLTTLKVYLS